MDKSELDLGELWLLLGNKPQAWAEVLAARSALRVLPLLATMFTQTSRAFDPSDILLSLFRGSAMPLLMGIAPAKAGKRRINAASEAAFATHQIVYSVFNGNFNLSFAHAAAAAAFAAASCAYVNPDAGSLTYYSDDRRSTQDDAVAAAGHALQFSTDAAGGDTRLRTNFLRDGIHLLENGDLRQLRDMPLWHDTSIPSSIELAWDDLTKSLSSIPGKADWKTVWIEWYEAVRDGRAPWQLVRETADRILLEVLMWPQTAWDKGAVHVNHRIERLLRARWVETVKAKARRLIKLGEARGYITYDELIKSLPEEQFTTEQIEAVLSELSENGINVIDYEEPEAIEDANTIVQQRPAAHVFIESDGFIVAQPLPVAAADPAVAEALKGELLAKARSLRDRLAQRGAELRPVESIDRLIIVLENPADQINVGLLLSRRRSIEADRKAYDSPEGRELLFPGALAAIEDVAESTSDLLAAFPAARQIEAGRVALELVADPLRWREVGESLDAITTSADGAPFVDETTRSALHAYDAALAEEQNIDAVAGILADRALDAANFIRRVAALARETGTPAAITLARAMRSTVGELSGLGKDGWAEIRKELPKGLGEGARSVGKMLPPAMLLLLLAAISKPLAIIVGGTQGLKSLGGLVDRLNSATDPNTDNSESGDEDSRRKPGSNQPRKKRTSKPST